MYECPNQTIANYPPAYTRLLIILSLSTVALIFALLGHCPLPFLIDPRRPNLSLFKNVYNTDDYATTQR
jgi:hypothetical protein